MVLQLFHIKKDKHSAFTVTVYVKSHGLILLDSAIKHINCSHCEKDKQLL